MLYLLTQLTIQNAEACDPAVATAELLNTFPANGSLEVPLDAVLLFEFGNGVLSEDMDFVLKQDEVELEIETKTVLHNPSLVGEQAIVEIAPVGQLAPDQDFIVELDGRPVMTFLTAKELAGEIEAVPSIGWVDQYFYDNTAYGEWNECGPATQTDLYLQFNGILPEHAVVINRVNPDGTPFVAENENEEPFFMILKPETDYISLIEQNTEENEEFCFSAAYVNEAGEAGEFSTPVCGSEYNYDEFRCGTGDFFGMMSCSAMPVQDFAWMSLAFGLVGLTRRRRK